jgi:competence protein ComEC
VAVSGERVELDAQRAGRLRSQHVVGELRADWWGDVRPGVALARSANRVRGLIAEGAAVLAPEPASLVRGLVIGDDSAQSPEMIARFRASGLSHLTAVSGQNVALTVACAGPLLRRWRPLGRWVATVGLIGWFVVVTRAEPSVLRAGAMAALGATAFALGRPRAPARLLPAAVIGLVLLDPLLVWSVGFWLSTGATAGVVMIGPWLAHRLWRLGPLALPIGITLGAQLGVALPSLLVFGRLSLIGTVANLLAVPVAGFVMFVGLPACLVAAVVPDVGEVVMAPIGLAARWIDAVATVAAELEPSGPVLVGGWLLLVGSVATLIAVGGRPSSVPDSAAP